MSLSAERVYVTRAVLFLAFVAMWAALLLPATASANQFCGTAKHGIYRVSKSGPITCRKALEGFGVFANTHHERAGWLCRTYYHQLRAGCRVPGGSRVVGRWKNTGGHPPPGRY
jgi:hypothetical protein